MFTDIHLHLLPGMDNGPARPWESERMFDLLYANGVRAAVLTPRFDADRETIDAFLIKRRLSYAKLKEILGEKAHHFGFYLSAEAVLTSGLSSLPSLPSLCIPKTNILPLSLPISDRLTPDIMKELAFLIQKRKLRPLLCHIERPYLFYSEKEFDRLLSLPSSLFQVSAHALSDSRFAFLLFRKISEGKEILLGSNGHNARSRPPLLFPEPLPEGISKRTLLALARRTHLLFHPQ